MKNIALSPLLLLLLVSCGQNSVTERAFVLEKTLHYNNEILDCAIYNDMNKIESDVTEYPSLKPLCDMVRELPEAIEKLRMLLCEIRVKATATHGIYLYEDEILWKSAESRKAIYKKKGHGKFIKTEDKKLDGCPVLASGNYIVERVLYGKEKLLDSLQRTYRHTMQHILATVEELPSMLKDQKLNLLEKEYFDTLNARIKAIYKSEASIEKLFKKASIAALYPVLSELEADALSAVALVTGFVRKQTGQKKSIYDEYEIFSSSENSYLLLGESYKAEIALGVYYSQVDFSAEVDGRSLPVRDGKAFFVEKTNQVGTQTYRATFNTVNSLTGETERYIKEYKYEVGLPSASIGTEEISVLYIGVEESIITTSVGIATADLDLRAVCSDCLEIRKISKGRFSIKAKKPIAMGEICYLELWNRKTEKKLSSKAFEIKYLRDPLLKTFDNSDFGEISVPNMRKQKGIKAFSTQLPDLAAELISYTVMFVSATGEIVSHENKGGAFDADFQKLVEKAESGDQFIFKEVTLAYPFDHRIRKAAMTGFVVK